MKYLYIDGDNIGLRIEQSFLNNDEHSLVLINKNVSNLVNQISEYLIENNQEIIFSGADGIISKGLNIDIPKIIDYIRLLESDLTFSIGAGSSLKDSYIALRYAKSISKNIGVEYINNEFSIIEGKITNGK